MRSIFTNQRVLTGLKLHSAPPSQYVMSPALDPGYIFVTFQIQRGIIKNPLLIGGPCHLIDN